LGTSHLTSRKNGIKHPAITAKNLPPENWEIAIGYATIFPAEPNYSLRNNFINKTGVSRLLNLFPDKINLSNYDIP
jgi:hypothetical protein